MGKWLAEFQENTPETDISCTDKTDSSHDVSVMSVPHQGILKEELIEPELMAPVSEACTGLDITPEQFIRILNGEAKKHIISGDLPASKLKNFAKEIDESIKAGVVKFITDMVEKEFNRNIANE